MPFDRVRFQLFKLTGRHASRLRRIVQGKIRAKSRMPIQRRVTHRPSRFTAMGKTAMESTTLSKDFSVRLARRNPSTLLNQPARNPQGNNRIPNARMASEMPLRSWSVNWEFICAFWKAHWDSIVEEDASPNIAH